MIVCTQCGNWIRKCQCEGQPDVVDTAVSSAAMSMSKEKRDWIRRDCDLSHRNCRPVQITPAEVRALLDLADERDELEKAVDPRGRRPPGTSIVQLAEWKTYLAGVRDRILTLVMHHCRDEDADADETIKRLVDERDRYRALLGDVLEDNGHAGYTTPETLNRIDAALEGKTND